MTIGEIFKTRAIDIRVTDTCNFNCSYCTEHDTIKKKYITYDEFVIILDKLEHLYNIEQKFQQVLLWGGEPTLNKDLQKMLELALTKPFINRLAVHSNFSIKNDQLIDFLCNNNIICYSSIHPQYFYNEHKNKIITSNFNKLFNASKLIEINLMWRQLDEFELIKKIKLEQSHLPLNITPTTQLVMASENKVKLLLKSTGEYDIKNISTSLGNKSYIDIFKIDHRGFICNSPVDNFIINTDGEIFLCQSYFMVNVSSGYNIFTVEDYDIFFKKTKCIHKTCICGHDIFKTRKELDTTEYENSYNLFKKDTNG